jgi:hypothetical protein
MELGQKKSGAEKKDMLQRAERDILFTYRIRPQLGGPEWTKKFDLLLRNVQQLLGNPKPTGLPVEPTNSTPGLPAGATTVQPVSTGAK